MGISMKLYLSVRGALYIDMQVGFRERNSVLEFYSISCYLSHSRQETYLAAQVVMSVISVRAKEKYYSKLCDTGDQILWNLM